MHLSRRRSIARRFVVCAALLRAAVAIHAQAAPSAPPASPSQPEKPAPAQTPTGTPVLPPSDQAAAWKTYSFPDEGFSASFPADPVKEKQSVATDAGAFELRTYLVASDAVALYIGVCDYGDAAKDGDPDAILEGAKNGAVSNVHAHLINAKKVTLGIYPGVAFEAGAEGAHFFGRIFLVGSKLYQAFVALPSDRLYPDTNRFLDSFQLIPRTTP